MRSTLIGIVIGLVLGVMAGATVVAPGIESARQPHSPDSQPEQTDAAESLDLGEGPQPPAPPSMNARANDAALQVASTLPLEWPVLGDMARRLENSQSPFIRIFAPGTLVPAGDIFDALKSGAVEAVLAPPGAWDPASPALQLFTAVPFGPGRDEMLAWFDQGGGRAMLQSRLAQEGVHAMLCGLTPAQGAGWYFESIRTPADFRGLTIRMDGLGADVMAKLGANVLNLGAQDTLARLEARRLDGAHFSLPAVDEHIGFQRFARNYYFPPWHRPYSAYVLAVHLPTWEALSPGAQMGVRQACRANVAATQAQADAGQFEALKNLGIAGVQVRTLPREVTDALERAWADVRREHISQDETFAKAWSSLQSFRRDYAIWRELSRP